MITARGGADPCIVVGVVPASEKRGLLLALFGLDPLFDIEPLRLRQDLDYVWWAINDPALSQPTGQPGLDLNKQPP